MGRSKRRHTEFEARMEALRASKGMIVVDGVHIPPGTPEYENELKRMAETLSEAELAGIAGKKSS